MRAAQTGQHRFDGATTLYVVLKMSNICCDTPA